MCYVQWVICPELYKPTYQSRFATDKFIAHISIYFFIYVTTFFCLLHFWLPDLFFLLLKTVKVKIYKCCGTCLVKQVKTAINWRTHLTSTESIISRSGPTVHHLRERGDKIHNGARFTKTIFNPQPNAHHHPPGILYTSLTCDQGLHCSSTFPNLSIEPLNLQVPIPLYSKSFFQNLLCFCALNETPCFVSKHHLCCFLKW